MRIESISSCEGCYFLKDGKSPQASCGRMGIFIEKGAVCLTGPLLSKPTTPEGWIDLVRLAQRNGVLIEYREINK